MGFFDKAKRKIEEIRQEHEDFREWWKEDDKRRAKERAKEIEKAEAERRRKEELGLCSQFGCDEPAISGGVCRQHFGAIF